MVFTVKCTTMAESRSENELQVSVDRCISAGEDSDSLLTLRVPNRLLCEWHREVATVDGVAYLELVNRSITDGMIALDRQCERLERRVAHKAGSVKNAVS